jgi:Holliday junction DNA helicase RuvA
VGGKVAVAILSALSDDDIYNAFLSGDKTVFTRADGVGPKLATRIITELKEKIVGKIDLSAAVTAMPKTSESGVINDVISALANLGYQKSDIMRVIFTMQPDKDVSFDALLKSVLKKLSSGV